jgi:hypothetical protein
MNIDHAPLESVQVVGYKNLVMEEKALLIELLEMLDDHARAVLNAKDFASRVHFADHVFCFLRSIEAEIESAVKGTVHLADDDDAQQPRLLFGTKNESTTIEHVAVPHAPLLDNHPIEIKSNGYHEPSRRPLSFRNKTLVEAGEILLRERPSLHGLEIERLMKDRNYPTRAKHFQKMLEATFTRSGKFINIGGNTWKLKEAPSENLNGNAPEAE